MSKQQVKPFSLYILAIAALIAVMGLLTARLSFAATIEPVATVVGDPDKQVITTPSFDPSKAVYPTPLPVTKPTTSDRTATTTANDLATAMNELQARYPDPSKITDIAAFAKQEAVQLEKIATLHCQNLGYRGSCDPTVSVATLGATNLVQKSGGNWWDWLLNHIANVGVIPAGATCQGITSSTLVEIYHDDEDRNNNNSYSGWIGGWVSNSNTRMRFCRLDSLRSLWFTELSGNSGTKDDYALLKLGLLCPVGGRTVFRHFDDEDNANANSGTGDYWPNFMGINKNWNMFFCVFDDGGGVMNAMPTLGGQYGVFAPSDFKLKISTGTVYEDNEDFFNLNWSTGTGSMFTWGGNSTFRLARVK